MAFYSEAVVWNCNLFRVKWHPDAYIQPCFFRSHHKWNDSQDKIFSLLYVNSKLRAIGNFTIKKKKNSFEPDSNQRPKDDNFNFYSPPLYQLSYRRNRCIKINNFQAEFDLTWLNLTWFKQFHPLISVFTHSLFLGIAFKLEKVGQLFQVSIHCRLCHPW